MPKVGDMVIYTMEFDSDKSYSPNVGAALVTKVNSDGSLDLAVFALNGMFYKFDVKQGAVGAREFWSPKP